MSDINASKCLGKYAVCTQKCSEFNLKHGLGIPVVKKKKKLGSFYNIECKQECRVI